MHVDTQAGNSPSIGPSSLDSVSDSEDWLEVDTESELNSSPSRRSSISLTSSTDDHVDAWEGLVEDSNRNSDISATPTAGPESPSDALVSAALDQSLVGTLSTSRSSSYGHASTPQNSSHRDLQLSFPDPLTSSLTGSDLHRTALRSSRMKAPLAASGSNILSFSSFPPEYPVLAQEPGPSSLESSMTSDEPPAQDGGSQPPVLFQIFLYGSSSPPRWSAVSALIQKANYGSGRGIISVSHLPESCTRHYHVETDSGLILSIAVHDRTMLSVENTDSQVGAHCPSLAFICLPLSGQANVPEHDYYLPVIVTVDQDSSTDPDLLLGEWQSLIIPVARRLELPPPPDASIITDEQLVQLDAATIATAMHPLVCNASACLSSEEPAPVAEKEDLETTAQLKGILSMSLAFMLAACVLSTFFGSQATPTRTLQEPGTLDIHMHDAINRTLSSNLETSLMPSSLKDYAISVFNAGVASSPQPRRRLDPSLYQTLSASSHSNTVQVSQEVSVRPSSSVSAVRPAMVPDAINTPSRAPSSSISFVSPVETNALSLRLVTDSLSMIYDFPNVKEVIDSVDEGLKEMTDALDQLGNAINDALTRGPLAVMEAVGEEMQYRNGRATKRAKEISDYGWAEWTRASTRARQNAKAIRRGVREGLVGVTKARDERD